MRSRSYSRNIVETLETRTLLSTTLTVPATSDPWLAAGIALTDGGTSPTVLNLPGGTQRIVTFDSVTGGVTNASPILAGLDGKPVASNIAGVGGVAGIKSSDGFFAMLGLFTSATVPASPPPPQDYSGTEANASFAPLLDQPFFIGDGKTGTGTGTTQQFRVPDNATKLYFGFADTAGNNRTGKPGAYGNNTGSLKVVVNVSAPPQIPSIAGTVFNDIGGDGKKDGADTGLPGVTVFLDTNKNGKLDANEASVKTNAAGAYSFTGLSTGVFSVREILPTDYRATTPMPVSATVIAGATATANFGDSQTAVISGTVFNDANGNKIKDPGEAGLSGVTVYLDLDNNGTLDFLDLQTKTDANGNYSFTVPFGTYTIREVAPNNYTRTTPVTPLTVSPAVLSAGNNIGDKHV